MRTLCHLAWAPILLASSIEAAAQSERPIDFSGVIYANYQIRTDPTARALNAGKAANKFDLQRVYLTFRMPAGDRASIRITTDIFQQSNPDANDFYAGWALRLKYAYLQYEFTERLAGVSGLGALGRLGMLHNVVIEHIDAHWPRWLGVNALETHGYFASADVGAAALVTLPSRFGEVYTTVVNGSGYTSGETDRFKDYAARATFTPFGRDSGFLRTLSITPWYSAGATASAFVEGGVGQVGPVSDGLRKDRRGVFLALRHRPLTGGFGFSQRVEGIESGSNTPASPRVVGTRTSRLIDGFAIVRPLELVRPRTRSPWSLIGRYDVFRIAQNQSAENRFLVAGVIYDLTQRTSLALDYQDLRPFGGSSTPRQTTWFLHLVANF